MGKKRSCRLMWGMGKASSSSSSSSPPAPAYVRLSGDEKRSISSSGEGGGGGGRACKGKVPVLVGGEREGEAMERVLIPTEMVKHPAIAALLRMSADEFGYQHHGAIRIPCDVDSLRTTLHMISKQTPRPTPWSSFLSLKRRSPLQLMF